MQDESNDGNEGTVDVTEREASLPLESDPDDEDMLEALEQRAFEEHIHAQLDQSAAEAEWYAAQEEEACEEASQQCRRRDPWRDQTDLCSNDDWHPDGYVGW